jgi:hypothetical protein
VQCTMCAAARGASASKAGARLSPGVPPAKYYRSPEQLGLCRNQYTYTACAAWAATHLNAGICHSKAALHKHTLHPANTPIMGACCWGSHTVSCSMGVNAWSHDAGVAGVAPRQPCRSIAAPTRPAYQLQPPPSHCIQPLVIGTPPGVTPIQKHAPPDVGPIPIPEAWGTWAALHLHLGRVADAALCAGPGLSFDTIELDASFLETTAQACLRQPHTPPHGVSSAPPPPAGAAQTLVMHVACATRSNACGFVVTPTCPHCTGTHRLLPSVPDSVPVLGAVRSTEHPRDDAAPPVGCRQPVERRLEARLGPGGPRRAQLLVQRSAPEVDGLLERAQVAARRGEDVDLHHYPVSSCILGTRLHHSALASVGLTPGVPNASDEVAAAHHLGGSNLQAPPNLSGQCRGSLAGDGERCALCCL